MKIITLDTLTKALTNKVGISKEEAREKAGMILDLFGHHDRIIDNVLQREGRALFYLLEAAGMMESGRYETYLHNGKQWRTHYWQLKRNIIWQCACISKKGNGKKTTVKKSIKLTSYTSSNPYTTLSEEYWSRKKN